MPNYTKQQLKTFIDKHVILSYEEKTVYGLLTGFTFNPKHGYYFIFGAGAIVESHARFNNYLCTVSLDKEFKIEEFNWPNW